ncbi:hypothetical protein EDD17DRAFT_618493 [Pisolithus thermaeus]|nr:hypothetical protein EDD17DRAFT_618493 [Pisolithus thermaeus]
MSLVMPTHAFAYHPFKQRRRTATDVLAGNFDIRPPRDVLTSLLNGVGPYKDVEKDEEMRNRRRRDKERERERDKERRDREREKKRASLATADKQPSADPPNTSHPSSPPPAQAIASQAAQPSSFWRARGTSQRPTINIATNQRSVSVTPPPMASSPRSTPGPSSSSVTSRTSSKRPRTPYDDVPLDEPFVVTPPPPQPPRKKRVAVKKGWKGWVEGSPPPSEKLINLDVVPILHERRTRSGKSFDAIGVGKETWV